MRFERTLPNGYTTHPETPVTGIDTAEQTLKHIQETSERLVAQEQTQRGILRAARWWILCAVLAGASAGFVIGVKL